MKISLDEGAFKPLVAHEGDGGLDLRALRGATIPAGGSRVFRTGVHVAIPKGYAGLLVSKSGLNVKHGITSTGLVDSGYTGEILVKLYNLSTEAYKIRKGDKITQLVVIKLLDESLEFVPRLTGPSERGDKGFGSSGR